MTKSTGIKKLYYSISEVSKITDLEQYVLRYWESEFEQLKPQKNRAGNRVYSNKDIKLILHIKQLLREERYTIEGAKQILKSWTTEQEGKQETLFPATDQADDKPQAGSASAHPTPAVGSHAKPSPVSGIDTFKEDLREMKSLLEELLVKI
ncbi:MAG TPA: MerR family transcriptional regulator [Bacteroidota bacterium]|nr:MerR family transcriptional regulator [Bacteroidota bacterium]